jgi:tetratricopeptide (TPR) repeat protein
MSERADFYKRGMALFGENKFDQAIEAYSQALEVSPDWTEALHGLAMAQMQANRVDEAIETGKRIAQLDKDDAFAHTSLSMFYQRKSQQIERAAVARQKAGTIPADELQEAKKQAAHWIQVAEEESAKARMISWKEELKTNPKAVPPGPAGSMDVLQ